MTKEIIYVYIFRQQETRRFAQGSAQWMPVFKLEIYFNFACYTSQEDILRTVNYPANIFSTKRRTLIRNSNNQRCKFIMY